MRRVNSPSPCDYRAMIEQARHGIFVHHNFRPLYANDAFAHLLGFIDVHEFMALPLLRPFIPAENWAAMEARHDEVMRGKIIQGLRRERLLRRDGQEIWLALTERKIIWQGNVAVECHAFDISEHMAFEQHLLASEYRLRAILEVLPYPVMIAACHSGQLVFVNRKACLLFAQSAASLLKSSIFSLFQDANDRRLFSDILTQVKEVREQEVWMQAAHGHQFLAEIAAIMIDYNGQPAMVLALNDISERKRLEAELFQQASTDALTGISNRRYFMARAEQEIRRARRFARPLAVLMIDLDHFKVVNDSYGHAGGDAVLCATVQTVNQALRSTDILGRLGGEEFAVLMPETDLIHATEVATRLRQVIAAQRIEFGKLTINITTSIGVTILQPDDHDIDAILHRADQALYIAKQDGRNRVVAAE